MPILVLQVVILALGSHLGRHLENDPLLMIRMKEIFSMLKSMKIVTDSVEKSFVTIYLGLGGIFSQIYLPITFFVLIYKTMYSLFVYSVLSPSVSSLYLLPQGHPGFSPVPVLHCAFSIFFLLLSCPGFFYLLCSLSKRQYTVYLFTVCFHPPFPLSIFFPQVIQVFRLSLCSTVYLPSPFYYLLALVSFIFFVLYLQGNIRFICLQCAFTLRFLSLSSSPRSSRFFTCLCAPLCIFHLLSTIFSPWFLLSSLLFIYTTMYSLFVYSALSPSVFALYLLPPRSSTFTCPCAPLCSFHLPSTLFFNLY